MPNPMLSSMAPAGHNDKLGLNRSAIAPSPTLTNPDMILPYGGEREASTPSPPFEALQRAAEHSRLLANSYSLMHQRNTSASTTTSYDRSSSGPDEPMHHYADSSVEGSPRVIYSSAGNGYTRSHISEIENTLRSHSRRPSRNNNNNIINNSSVDSLVDPGYGLAANDGVSKRHSKLKELQDLSEGFFDQDKVHIDEEQPDAQAGADDLGAVIFEPEHRILPMGAIAEEDEDDEDKDKDGHSEKGGEVDDIEELTSMLENAKLKLTHMEGNLNRARTSFRMTPSPAPSLNRAFGSPGSSYYKPLAKGERRSQTSLAGALLRQRANQGIAGNFSHLRGQSDLYSPSSQSQNRLSGTNGQFRSYSALGSTSASEYRTGFFSQPDEPYDKEPSVEANSPSREITTDISRSLTPSRSPSISNEQSQASPLLSGDAKSSPSSSKSQPLINQPTSSSQSTTPPSPTNSQIQMRGLQGQVDGLRSKLSTLKERTQEESIRRRSQQSLRTPSPFTVADQSYANPLEYQRRSSYPETLSIPNYDKPQPSPTHNEDTPDTTSKDTTSKPSPSRPAEEKIVMEETVQESVEEPVEEPEEEPIKGPVGELIEGSVEEPVEESAEELVEESVEDAAAKTDDSESEYFGYSDEESEHSEIDREALEEILREPLSSPTDTLDQELLEEFPAVPAIPETIRHEDRIDAFDYEHFILHSALGTYTGRLNRSGSFCSVGSVETTRPSSLVDGRKKPKNKPSLSRVTSNDSILTDASFATATEGDDEYGDTGVLTRHLTKDSLTIPAHQQYNCNTPSPPRTKSTSSTPRAYIEQENATNDEKAALLASILELKRAAATPPTPTLLVRSILSSAANEKASSDSRTYSPHSDTLSGADAELVEAVIQSLGNVSLELLRASTADFQSNIDNRIVTILRRRLEAARRILDGVSPLEANS
ncbi:hypothetical protein McanMca71_003531 [Microsporum canis]